MLIKVAFDVYRWRLNVSRNIDIVYLSQGCIFFLHQELSLNLFATVISLARVSILPPALYLYISIMILEKLLRARRMFCYWAWTRLCKI